LLSVSDFKEEKKIIVVEFHYENLSFLHGVADTRVIFLVRILSRAFISLTLRIEEFKFFHSKGDFTLIFISFEQI